MSYNIKKIIHLRREKSEHAALEPKANFNWFLSGKMSNYGGATIVTVGSGNKYSTGVSICSTSDTYNKRVGINLALARAIKGLKDNVVVVMPNSQLDLGELQTILLSINPKHLITVEEK